MPRQEPLKAAVCQPEVASLAHRHGCPTGSNHIQVLCTFRSGRKLRQACLAGVQPASKPS